MEINTVPTLTSPVAESVSIQLSMQQPLISVCLLQVAPPFALIIQTVFEVSTAQCHELWGVARSVGAQDHIYYFPL